MKKIINWKLLLLVIVFIAVFLRLWNIGGAPISLSDDEVRESYSAYSFYHTLKDVNGHYIPLTFNMEAVNFGPVSIYISSLFFSILELSVFSSRLPYALVSVLSVLLLFLITKKITNNYTIALISSFAMAVSGWHIQISRVAYDPAFSMFFYLLGIFLFVNQRKKTVLITLLSMIFFLLGFYSYAATKIIFLPFILILTIYKLKDLSKKQLFIIIFFTVFTFLSFFYLDKTQKAAQYAGGPFFFTNNYKDAEVIELERRTYINAPEILKTVFNNKVTYWFGVFNHQYFYAFSTQFLFINQEPSAIFSMWDRGELYLFEALFLVLGTLYLYKSRKRELVFVIFMLLSSALPSGIGSYTPTYVIRSELMIPFLYILIGAGIFSVYNFFKNKYLKVVFVVIMITLYTYFAFGYFVEYHYRFAYSHVKDFSKSTKDLVDYVNKNKDKKIFIAGGTQNTLLHYAFYNKIDPNKIQVVFRNNPIIIDNIILERNCLMDGLGDPRDYIQENSIYISPEKCHKKSDPDNTIRTFGNTETIWKIYIK